MIAGLVLLLVASQAPPSTPAPSAPRVEAPAYVPQRVYDTRRNTFSDFEVMLADLAHADVVLVGEQHDDPNTHRLEAAVLDGLGRRKVPVTLSLEMFERDVQPALDAYLAGRTPEAEFLKGARPWPRYVTDYRSLVEMAKEHGWPVVASNVPRRIASEIAKSGRDAVDSLTAADRAFAARDLECPHGPYFERFAEQMGGHSTAGKGAEADATTDRYFWAQCVKDETMAESIAGAFTPRGDKLPTIVHFTGAFHSDFGAGTAERVRRRLDGRRVAVVTMIPVADIDAAAPGDDDRKRADYIVYTTK